MQKSSTVTRVSGTMVYYYNATTGTTVSSRKDFSGWRGPHKVGNDDLEYQFTRTYNQQYTVSVAVSSTMGWEEGVVKSKASGVYQMAQYVPSINTTYTAKCSDLSGGNIKTIYSVKLAMPRVDCSYPDYYKKCDLAA